MSALRPAVLGIMVVGILAHEVRAEPISWPGWLAFIVNQTQPGNGNRLSGHASAPIAPSQPITYSPLTPIYAEPQPIIANAPVNGGLIATPLAMSAVAPPAVAAVPAIPSAAAAAPVDAFINLGAGPYPGATSITTGNAQPWYNSAEVAAVFGGQPTAQQQQDFDNTILQRVQQTFSQSGVSVTLTDNPNVAALHTLSVVSNTTASSLPSAIGMTQVGGNGFSFVDVSAPSAQSVNQLEWIVAHNISHELMLAFGVGENYDKSGQYIDSKVANFAMMVSPTATFSPAAAQAISQALASQTGSASQNQLGAQIIEEAVPEPATLAVWVLAATSLVVSRVIRSRRSAAA